MVTHFDLDDELTGTTMWQLKLRSREGVNNDCIEKVRLSINELLFFTPQLFATSFSGKYEVQFWNMLQSMKLRMS